MSIVTPEWTMRLVELDDRSEEPAVFVENGCKQVACLHFFVFVPSSSSGTSGSRSQTLHERGFPCCVDEAIVECLEACQVSSLFHCTTHTRETNFSQW